MTIWSLRKMQVYVFYAAHAAKESVPWRISPNTAGIMTVSLVQTVFTLTTLCAASVVVREPISEPHLLIVSACTVALFAVLNYFTLVFRGQWRHFVHEFHDHTVDDLFFASAGLSLGSIIWWLLLMFWAGDVTRVGH